MAGGNTNNPSIASLTPISTFTVFINSNLDTYLAVVLSSDETVADLKSKVRSLHPLCFPNIGEITVNAVKVKRESWFYHLPDPVLVKSAFDRMEGTWFLHIDAAPACNQAIENVRTLENDEQLQDPHLLCLVAETNDLQVPKDREILETSNLGPKDHSPEFGKNNFISDQEEKCVSYKDNGTSHIKDDEGNAPLVVFKTDEAEERTGDNLPQIDEELEEILKPVTVGRKRKKKKEKKDGDTESMKVILLADSLEAKEVVASERLSDKPPLSDLSPARAVMSKKKKRKFNHLDVEPMVSHRTTQRSSSLVTEDTEHEQKSTFQKENLVPSPGKKGNQENCQNALGEDYDDARKQVNPGTTLEEMAKNRAPSLDAIKEAAFAMPVESQIDASKQQMQTRGKKVRRSKSTQAASTDVLALPLVEEPAEGTSRVTRSSYKHINPGGFTEKLETLLPEAGKQKTRVVAEPSSSSPLLSSSEAAKNNTSGINLPQLTQRLGITESVDTAEKKRKKSAKTRPASTVENIDRDKEETVLSKAGMPTVMAVSETNSPIPLPNSSNVVTDNYITQSGDTEAVDSAGKKRKKFMKPKRASAIENDNTEKGKTFPSQSGKLKTMAMTETNSLSPLLNSSKEDTDGGSINRLEFTQNGVLMALDTTGKKRMKSTKTRPAAAIEDGDAEKEGTVLSQAGKSKIVAVEETNSPLTLLNSLKVTNNNKSGIDTLQLTQSGVTEAMDTAEEKRKELTNHLQILKEEADHGSDNKIDSLQVEQISRAGEAVGAIDKKIKKKSKNSRATITKSLTEALSKLPDEHGTFGDGKNLDLQQSDANSNLRNQLLGSMTEVEKGSKIETKQMQKNFSNGFESNMQSGSPEANTRGVDNVEDGCFDKVIDEETHKFERDAINFIDYFTPKVKKSKFIVPAEKIGAKKIQKERAQKEKNNRKKLKKLGHKEREISLKENGAAGATSSASTECSEGSLYRSQLGKRLPSGGHYWVSVRKPSTVNSGEVLKNSNQKKSLLSGSDPIFDNVSAESSEGEDGENKSEAISRSLSDSSSASAYSDGEQEETLSKALGSADFQAPENGSLQSAAHGGKNRQNIGSNIGRAKYTDSSAKGLSLSQILKGSSGYKKAIQKASQSRLELEETQSQPVDIVFETQLSQP